MPLITAKELLDAGAHFGHHTGKWHPNMAPYIFTKRNKIHIINLRETVRGTIAGYYFLKEITAEGKSVLLVGTKYQAAEVMRSFAKSVSMPFVAQRWLGGTLTNLEIIRRQVKRWDELDRMEADNVMQRLSKKRVSSLRREHRRIVRNLEGIRNMKGLPGAMLVVDPSWEYIAVREAAKMGIPIVGIVDTDNDPNAVDIPIPANDDSIRSVELIISRLIKGVEAGKKEAEKRRLEKRDKVRGEPVGKRRPDKKIKDVPLPAGAVSVAPEDAENKETAGAGDAAEKETPPKEKDA